MIAMHVIGFVAFIVAWLKGGHQERFGVAVLVTGYMISSHTYLWRIDDVYWAAAAQDLVMTGLFGRLAFTTSRWWPLVMTALFALVMLVHLLAIAVPDLSEYAAVSAHIGLATLINATLLVGVGERWLAGERPVSDLGNRRPRRRSEPLNI